MIDLMYPVGVSQNGVYLRGTLFPDKPVLFLRTWEKP